MILDEMLDVLQVQRHDFLNHLQVISGLLQLNKVDGVRSYIDKTTTEMRMLSSITRIKHPYLKAVFLIGMNKAQRYQIDFIYDIKINLNEQEFADEMVSLVLEKGISLVLEQLKTPSVLDRRLLLQVSECEGEIVFKVNFPGLPIEKKADLKNQWRHGCPLPDHGAQPKMRLGEVETGILLTIPING